MKGEILAFFLQNNSGIIITPQGQRYSFANLDWQGDGFPVPGLAVDFLADGHQARAIHPLPSRNAQPKDRIAAGVLAIFLGSLGLHKFYLGFPISGLIFLLSNTIGVVLFCLLLGIPNIALWIIALIEGIIYLTKTDAEFHQTYVVKRQEWF